MSGVKPIIVVGAGACGLMAARELAKAGKKIIVLEARNRIGGRIWPLSKKEFGYPAQAGAEFVHGAAPITKSLIQEAGLAFVATNGEIWSAHEGELTREDNFLPPNQDLFHKTLKGLKEDMPISKFFEKYLPEEKYAPLRSAAMRMVEGYDAADPDKISVFSLREEWLGEENEWEQGKIIKEGYGALLRFLESACRKNGVEIYLDREVAAVETREDGISVTCANGEKYEAEKAVITVPLPVLTSIKFNPAIPEKIAAASKIGFGGVIKILLRFKNAWWENVHGKDLNKLGFLFSDEAVPVWWTQYPEISTILTGWLAGPSALKFSPGGGSASGGKNAGSEKILGLALISLANIFQVDVEYLKKQLTNSIVANWLVDPYSQGAYSYSTIESEEAYAELRKPVDNRIFFASEALCLGKESATVEGAFASGIETAKKILGI